MIHCQEKNVTTVAERLRYAWPGGGHGAGDSADRYERRFCGADRIAHENLWETGDDVCGRVYRLTGDEFIRHVDTSRQTSYFTKNGREIFSAVFISIVSVLAVSFVPRDRALRIRIPNPGDKRYEKYRYYRDKNGGENFSAVFCEVTCLAWSIDLASKYIAGEPINPATNVVAGFS